MGEEWAQRLIQQGYCSIAGEVYDIVKSESGHCDGCDLFIGGQRPICSLVRVMNEDRDIGSPVTVCTTGGQIFLRRKGTI